MRKIIFLFDLYRKIWENAEKSEKMMKIGQILMKKVEIDEKMQKYYFFQFFRKIWKNVEESEK